MIRLSVAALALIALSLPSNAVECPQPVWAENVVCLDPDGPITSTPTTRSRTFSMNGRTLDRIERNIFWVVQGDWSVGNWGNPKIVITEYFGGGPKNTRFEFTTPGTYATQHPAGSDLRLFLTVYLRDVNYQDLPGAIGTAYGTMRCSKGPAQTIAGDRPFIKDGDFLNPLTDVAFVVLESRPRDADNPHWVPC